MKKDLGISISPADLELNTGAFYNKYKANILAAFDWVETTQKSYDNTMDNASVFLSDISFCDCTTDDFDFAIKKINDRRVQNRKKAYSENTLKGFRSVFTDLCYFAETYSNGLYSSVVWGSEWRNREKKEPKKPQPDDPKRAELQVTLPRSLTLTQEVKLINEITRNIEKNSFYAGLALVFYLGLRPGECCGVTYGDIRPLEGYSEAYCLYVYNQLTSEKKSSNDLKSANAYRILPVPAELYQLISRRETFVNRILKGECNNCPIVCLDNTRQGLQTQCNRRRFRVFSQGLLRSIRVDEHVVINLTREIKGQRVSESNVTTYILRRNFATALSGVCGMDDDELKYLMGHAIGTSYEKRHDFVNPDTLFQLWDKLNLRSYLSPYQPTYTISSRKEPLVLKQKSAKIKICKSALEGEGVYLRVFNTFPNDYVMVEIKSGTNTGITYRTGLEPSELKRIGRIRMTSEFSEAVHKARNKIKNKE